VRRHALSIVDARAAGLDELVTERGQFM
jgi:hypothetical protein